MEKSTILIIDDDWEKWETLLRKIFDESKYTLDFSSDGSSMQDVSRLDLVLCDYYLHDSELTGVEWVKENIAPRDPFLPVIFWTSSMNPEVVQQTTAFGKYVFFKKKLDIPSLVKIAEELVNERINQRLFPLYNEFFNIRIKDRNYRELAHKVYVNASRYLESFFAHSKYHTVFNAHGLIHAKHVLDNLAQLLLYCETSNEEKEVFTEREYLEIYIAAIIHDLGMIPPRHSKELELEEFKNVRKGHCKRIWWWIITKQLEDILSISINGILKNHDHIESKKVRYGVAFLCLYHDGGYEFSKYLCAEHIKDAQEFSKKEKNILGKKDEDIEEFDHSFLRDMNKDSNNLKILSALIALADKLDYGVSRVPVDILRRSPYRSWKDEFEYLKNESFEGYNIITNPTDGFVLTINVKTPEHINDIEILREQKIDNSFFEFKNSYQADFQDSNKILKYVVYDTVIKVFDKTWKQIKDVFQAPEIDFLKNLKLHYNFIHTNPIQIQEKPYPAQNVDVNDERLNEEELGLLYHIFNKEEYERCSLKIVNEGFSDEITLLGKRISKKMKIGGSYELQDKFIKIGDFKWIHKEVNNYLNYALPFINSRNLIGSIDEYKYLDLGGYVGSLILYEGEEIKSLNDALDEIHDYSQYEEAITDTLRIFYENINPIRTSDNAEFILNKYYKPLFKAKTEKLLESIDSEKIACKLDEILKKIANQRIDMSASIVHGDFTFRNILMVGDKQYVFIDFALTTIGHFCIDYAKLDHYLRFEKLLENENLAKIDVVELERTLIEEKEGTRDHYQKIASKIYYLIQKICYEMYSELQITKEEFMIEYRLAQLYINLWCLTYKKFELKDIKLRKKIFDLYYDDLKKRLLNN